MEIASDTQIDSAKIERNAETAAFVERVRVNQQKLSAELKSHYDFIVCGSGSSGSVVARRLAENPDVSVLLLEAGGSDEMPSVTEATQWRTNLGSERNWNFQAQPDARLNGRSMPMNMGKVLGGGSSINAMYWVRGHKTDWDFFASEADDPAWNYESVKRIYRRIEDWGGEPDSEHRGTGGPVFVMPAHLQPVGAAMCESARSMGIPTFENLNGRMMEAEGGCSASELRIRDGRRLSIFRSYTFPYMDRPNLTVLTHATVTRLVMDGKRASGVEIAYNSKVHRIGAGLEVVLSLGAINTPKVLMQSGIGDRSELHRLGIPLVEHLPGVGQNFQDHVVFASCIWECKQPIEDSGNSQALFFWKSDPTLESPDMQVYQGINLRAGMANLQPSASSMTMVPSIVRPMSRGHLRLTGPDPLDPVEIRADILADPDDLKAMTAAIDLCREIGNSGVFESLLEREVTPGSLKGPALEQVVRNSVSTIWHQSCTAKMGRDFMSVVDGHLRVYGIDNLRIADGSIMPRVSTGNTMAPCVVIGERCAQILQAHHRIQI
jgi:choline dehydrogenase